MQFHIHEAYFMPIQCHLLNQKENSDEKYKFIDKIPFYLTKLICCFFTFYWQLFFSGEKKKWSSRWHGHQFCCLNIARPCLFQPVKTYFAKLVVTRGHETKHFSQCIYVSAKLQSNERGSQKATVFPILSHLGSYLP